MFKTKVVQKIKTHILCSITPPPSPENRAVYEMWKKFCRAGQATHDMRTACWIPKARNTPPEYVILIAFPLQQRLHERASMLRYTHIACLVFPNFQLSKNCCEAQKSIIQKKDMGREESRKSAVCAISLRIFRAT